MASIERSLKMIQENDINEKSIPTLKKLSKHFLELSEQLKTKTNDNRDTLHKTNKRPRVNG